jgi:5-methylcytosine-specific restriction endonuclease McrA
MRETATEPTENQRRRHRIHAHARRKQWRVFNKSGGKCYWCGLPLVRLMTINPAHIIRQSVDVVVWRDQNGVQQRRHVMTIDHFQPVSKGGGNALENLVAACWQCNQKRSAMPSSKSIVERRICPKCGQPKDPKRRKCADCRRGTGRPE